jgi:hypothetical protein
MSGVLQFKLINIGRCFQKNAALLNTLRSSIRRSHSFHERYLGQMRKTIKPLINHKTLFGSTTIGVGLVGFGYFNKMNLFSDHHNLKEYFNNFIKLLMENFFRTAKCESEKKNKRRTEDYEKTTNKSASSGEEIFDWKEFFRLIYTEKYYFILAVVVSLFV